MCASKDESSPQNQDILDCIGDCNPTEAGRGICSKLGGRLS